MKFIDRSLSNQFGGILPLFVILIVGVIGIAALTIDQGRGLLVHRNAEDLADAVALAASASLDGTKLGWQNAKRLALITVNESRVHGVDPEMARAVKNFGAGDDPWEDDANKFGGNVLSIDDGKLTVTIERGFYAYTESDEVPEFTSLEGAGANHFHLPKFFIANAVRATVEVTDIATPLGNVVARLSTDQDFEKFDSIGGESIAVRHNELEFPVAPIAIPACELLANMDVSSSGRYHSEGLQPTNGLGMGEVHARAMSNQCQREIIAREPAALDGDYQSKKERIDGNLRAESYPRPPLTVFEKGESALCYASDVEGLHINCKAQPLNASLGAAGAGGAASKPIGATALAAALNDSAGLNPTHVAKLGASFNPMGESSYLDDRSVAAAALNLINDGASFRSVFYDGDQPALNFPFRRNLLSTAGGSNYTDPFAEIRITWTTKSKNFFDDEGIEVAMLMGNSGDFHPDTDLERATAGPHLRYTNPLCHNNAIPFDDKDRGRAKTVNVMLVASPDEPYCDFDSELGSRKAINAIAPQSTTSPVIVGYVQAHIFDFRLSRYDEQDWWLGGPDDPDLDDQGTDLPAADEEGNVLTDDNQFAFDSQFELPGVKEYLQAAENFAKDKKDFLRCESCLNSGFPDPECKEEKDVYQAGGDTCPDQPEEIEPPPIPTWMDDCFGGSAAIIDLLSLIDDLDPFVPPLVDDQGNPAGPGAGQLPPCKEMCGGVRKYDKGTLYFVREGEDAYNTECYNQLVGILEGKVCSPDDNFWEEDTAGEGQSDGMDCTGGCPDSGCCISFPRPPLPDESCSTLCRDAPAGKSRFTCRDLCNEFRRQGDEEAALIEYLKAIEDIFEKFKDLMEERYGSGDSDNEEEGEEEEEEGNENDPGDGNNPSPDEEPQISGTNGKTLAPKSNKLDYIETTDGASDICLPRRLNDCFDMTNPKCWEDPTPRKSGWGCGGIRLRLSCSDNSLFAPRAFRDLRPALVSK